MVDISREGSGKFDFWIVDQQRAFATIPEGIIPEIQGPIDICLQNGDDRFGYRHIVKRHSSWLKKNEVSPCPAELLYHKLGNRGQIHRIIEEDNKYTLSIQISPSAFIVCKYHQKLGAMTVTTIYPRQNRNTSEYIARYYHHYRR